VNRKIIGIAAAVAIAGAGTYFVVGSSGSGPAAAPVAPPEAIVKVLKVTKQVPKGTPVAELGDYVQQVDVPLSQQQPNTATSLDDLTDKTMVATADLLPEDQVSKLRFESATKLSSTDIVTVGAGEADDLTSLVGVWVNLPPLNALNGNLKPGVTKVAVFAAFEPMPGIGSDASKDVATNHVIAHKVPVLDMYPPAGIAVAPAPTGDGTQPPAAAPVQPTSIQVKLGLDAATAERVIFTQMKGTLFLGEEGLAVEEGGTKIVERGNVYEPTQKPNPVKTAPKPVAKVDSALADDPALAVNGSPQANATPKPVANAPKPVAPTPVNDAPAPALANAGAAPAPVVK
jgi:pilus assembly protein CpaB